MLAGAVAGLDTQTAEHKYIPFKKDILNLEPDKLRYQPKVEPDCEMFAQQEMKRSLASEACQYVPRQMPVQVFRI